MKIAVAVIVVLALICVGLLLPGYMERRAQLDKTFTALEHLQAAVDAGAGLLEYKHRLVEATAAMERMGQLDPRFAETPIGKEMASALPRYTEATSFEGTEKVQLKQILLELSEVTIYEADASDKRRFRDVLRWKAASAPEAARYLEPFTYGTFIRGAYLERAAGHLHNAQILAGRKRGETYTPPRPRPESEWSMLLPIEHPARAADYRVEQENRRRIERLRQEAHRNEFPLHLEIRALATGFVGLTVDGDEREPELLVEGDRKHIDAHDFIEIDVSVLNGVEVKVNGTAWQPSWKASHNRLTDFGARVSKMEVAQRKER